MIFQIVFYILYFVNYQKYEPNTQNINIWEAL